MPTNKNAVIRYNTLDKCFKNIGRKYYFEDLKEAVNLAIVEYNPESDGVKTRQIRSDIQFMKSEEGYGAPIECYREGKTGFYRYSDPDFSINGQPLNHTESEQLRNALSILNRFDGAPQFEWIGEVRAMLNSEFGLSNAKGPIMEFESNIDYKGYDLITPLFNAITNNQVLLITYETFDNSSFEIEFHPYFLKQYNNRWFVFGMNRHNENPQWNMPLDRISSINECNSPYIADQTDWKDFFDEMIGVTKMERQPEDVVVRFTKKQAPYVRTKPLHLSQRHQEMKDGSLIVTLNLIVNYELKSKLLAYGSSAEILSPLDLRKDIENEISDMRMNYSRQEE